MGETVVELETEVQLMNQTAWRSVAVALIIAFLMTLGGGGVSFIQFNRAQADEQEDLARNQLESKQQTKLLIEAVVSLKDISEQHSESLTDIERELRYNRCMNEKHNVQACVPILLP